MGGIGRELGLKGGGLDMCYESTSAVSVIARCIVTIPQTPSKLHACPDLSHREGYAHHHPLVLLIPPL